MVPLLFPRVWFGLCWSSAVPSHRRQPAAEWNGGGDGRPELGRRRLPPLHLGGEGTPRPHRLPHRFRPLLRRPPTGHPRRRLQRRIRRSLPYPFLHPQSRIPIDCLFFSSFFFIFRFYCIAVVDFFFFFGVVQNISINDGDGGKKGRYLCFDFEKKKNSEGKKMSIFCGCLCVLIAAFLIAGLLGISSWRNPFVYFVGTMDLHMTLSFMVRKMKLVFSWGINTCGGLWHLYCFFG